MPMAWPPPDGLNTESMQRADHHVSCDDVARARLPWAGALRVIETNTARQRGAGRQDSCVPPVMGGIVLQ